MNPTTHQSTTQNPLRELFIENIRDLYDAEKQLTKALPKIIKAANSEELAEAVRHHLVETEEHVTRLEEVFRMMDAPARGKSCKGMKGLLEEGSEVMSEHDNDGVMADLAIIAAAQKVEHYEVSGYGTARTIAERLGEEDVVKLLQQIQDEERKADDTLTQVAMSLYESADTLEDTEQQTTPRSRGRSHGNSKTTRTSR